MVDDACVLLKSFQAGCLPLNDCNPKRQGFVVSKWFKTPRRPGTQSLSILLPQKVIECGHRLEPMDWPTWGLSDGPKGCEDKGTA